MCGEPSNVQARKHRNKTKTTNMQSSLPSPHHSKKSTILGLIFWLFAVLIFFYPAVFSDKVLAPTDCVECIFRPTATKPIKNVYNQYVSDGATQYIPHKWILKQQWEQDGYMGWNPYVFNGTASPENTMYSPSDWHNYLFAFLPFWTAWDLGIILQFFIAGCGMLLLMRYHHVTIWGALLAAISYAFYSQFVICLYYRWLGTMIWAPYLVWALLKYKKHLVNIPAIIFMALSWRGGHMQSCSFIALTVAYVWLAEIWKKDGQWQEWKSIVLTTLSYFLTGAIGALLSLDVFIDTLQRMEGCKELGFQHGLNNLLMLPTTLFPNIMGVPQTIDIAKPFGMSLFDIKFAGGVIFILAIVGCFNKQAPRTAKVLFILSFVASCCPLYTFIYSRGTVAMALGMSWLAGWQLNYMITHRHNTAPLLKRALILVFLLTILWLIASIFITLYKDELVNIMTSQMTARSITAQQIARKSWYIIRIERFLSQILIWHWQNLLLVCTMMLGLFCCFRIRAGHKNTLLATSVVALTFAELMIFAHPWLSYSKATDGPYLYQAPEWLAKLKGHVGTGALATHSAEGDKDFLCLNHLASYGIHLADGYETVRPKYLRPLKNDFDTKDYAAAGISHILADTKWAIPNIPGWQPVMIEKNFMLFSNPDYRGKYLLNGRTSIKPTSRTCSQLQFDLPPHSHDLTLLQSYHLGWKAYIDTQELPITPTEHYGMNIKLPDSEQTTTLKLEFHMPWQKRYYSIMALTALILGITAWRQKSLD